MKTIYENFTKHAVNISQDSLKCPNFLKISPL